jgi:hypothetical protein
MKLKISSFLFIGFLIFSTMLFFCLIGSSYYDYANFSIGADSGAYYNAAKYSIFDEKSAIDLRYNYLGSLLVLSVAGLDNFLVFIVNILLFSLAYLCITNSYPLNKTKFLLLLVANPMVTASLLLVNKEILGLFSVAMFLCYLKQKKCRFLIASLVFALLTRWEMVAVFALFFLLNSHINPFRLNRVKSLLVLVLGISIVYPIFLVQILGQITSEDTILAQANTLATPLNYLQDNYLFFVALVPKVLGNSFGNVTRVFGYLVNPEQIDLFDIYNSFIILGHQLAMFFLIVLMYRKKLINVKSDPMYFSCMYLILFSLGYMIQYRYIFPLYVLFCFQISLPRNVQGYSTPTGLDKVQ